ncbi:MAG: hypothetical protein OXE75_08785, partial [bacterium]|nr:hypothetical protein [bacterium]
MSLARINSALALLTLRSGKRVAPVVGFGADRRGDGEGGLGGSVLGAPVGVAAELAEVRQPRVGAFDGPSQRRWGGGFVRGGTVWS